MMYMKDVRKNSKEYKRLSDDLHDFDESVILDAKYKDVCYFSKDNDKEYDGVMAQMAFGRMMKRMFGDKPLVRQNKDNTISYIIRSTTDSFDTRAELICKRRLDMDAVDEFISYVLSFYNGIYADMFDGEVIAKEEVAAAKKKLVRYAKAIKSGKITTASEGKYQFDGDSYDRELCRDIMLHARGLSYDDLEHGWRVEEVLV